MPESPSQGGDAQRSPSRSTAAASHPCPRCAAAVPVRAVTCPNCGVDLALAAVLLERMALSAVPAEPGTPFVGDAMLSRFGEFLMKKGYINESNLDAALQRQRELASGGVRETLGQVLLEMHILTREQLELASVEQVQDLQNALRQVNAQLEQRVADRTRELQSAYQRLAELDRLKGNFIANISHELRTPLTKIKGFNALLAAGDLGPLGPDQVQAVEIMGRGAQELERLISDLIQFASGARGEMVLRLAPTAIGEIFERIAAQAADKAVRRGVRIEVRTADDLPMVSVDAEKIRWVLNQLLDNAIKFTPRDGTVTLGAELIDDRMLVSIADTGPGIEADKLPELFAAFHQIDGSTTRQQGGTGIGLALVKMIIEAHESDVHAESEPGHGCRFSFDLRLAED